MAATWLNDGQVLVAVSAGLDVPADHLEVVDLATQSVVRTVTLSQKLMIYAGMSVDQGGGMAVVETLGSDHSELATVNLTSGMVTMVRNPAENGLRAPVVTSGGMVLAVAAQPLVHYNHDNDAVVVVDTNGRLSRRVTPQGLAINSFAIADLAGLAFVEGWDDAGQYGIWVIGLDGAGLRQVVSKKGIHAVAIDARGTNLALVVSDSPVSHSVIYVPVLDHVQQLGP